MKTLNYLGLFLGVFIGSLGTFALLRDTEIPIKNQNVPLIVYYPKPEIFPTLHTVQLVKNRTKKPNKENIEHSDNKVNDEVNILLEKELFQ